MCLTELHITIVSYLPRNEHHLNPTPLGHTLHNLNIHLFFRQPRSIRIFQRMRHQLITKQDIHLLQRPAFGLRVEENVADERDHVERKEDVKVAEANGCESRGAELREDEVEGPVGEGGDCVAEGADLGWEDLKCC